jgi:hypothetical protein
VHVIKIVSPRGTVVVASGRVALLGSSQDGADGRFVGQEIVVEMEITLQWECAGVSLLLGVERRIGILDGESVRHADLVGGREPGEDDVGDVGYGVGRTRGVADGGMQI